MDICDPNVPLPPRELTPLHIRPIVRAMGDQEKEQGQTLVQIQEPVPRAETLRARLAAMAWREGTSTFVTNEVPFSYSSGSLLAKSIADLVCDRAGRVAGTVRVMELGAGLGYLSRHVMDRLRDASPDVYGRCEFVVTDGSTEVVREMQARGILAVHSGRVTVRVADLRDPETITGFRPHVVMMSYLLDSIPPQVVSEEGAVEIATSISNEATLANTATWPPRFLVGDALQDALKEPERLAVAVARRASGLLVESPRSSQPTFRNQRPEIVDLLTGVLRGLPDEALMVITDFGYADEHASAPFAELMTDYGLCAFWAVFFHELAVGARVGGFSASLHRGHEGGTHTMAIYSPSEETALQQAFRSAFDGVESDRPATVLYALEEDASPEDVLAAVEKIERTMGSEEVDSYGNLSRFVHLLLPFGHVREAERYARRCFDLYAEIAAPEAAILGSLVGRRGNLDEAKEWFERSIQIAPGYGPGHHGLAGVSRMRADWQTYYGAMQSYIEACDGDLFAPMLSVAETLEGTPLDAEGREARQWLGGAARDVPWLVPEDVRSQIQ